MIKVRITPLLKGLGFQYVGGSSYIYKQGDKVFYEGRIYKRGGEDRYIKVIQTHYDEFGYLHHRSFLCKNLCLDISDEHIGSIIIWIAFLAREIGNFDYVMKNMNYWLGLETEKYEIEQTIEKNNKDEITEKKTFLKTSKKIRLFKNIMPPFVLATKGFYRNSKK
ncbi:hypothetical protein ACU8Z2_28180 (plasmid) [Bacillus paranthracis]|uniref:Uncharacterized protein n=1 Tax=Bacillus thuringiensis TaxID=1428 RepID=A0A4Y8SXY3_BACTU|nr:MULTISPECIES: hypothetical protein [Bacillus cereus group]EJR42761.1 hypothetical protein IIK_05565 [Bacillus cereus VD102]KMP78662.1 hypothetical protein TU63_31640 [Bacillus cereus]MBR3118774.1 hypothetical protein [Oceanobacillus sp.]MCC2341909.1 hypothetical protein [Bacillus tropicus]MCC2352970.1 hypothetical protein [Bacillus pacificus]